MTKRLLGRKIISLILLSMVFIALISFFVSAAYDTTPKKAVEESLKDVFGGKGIWGMIRYIFAAEWIKTQLDFLATMRIFFFFFVFTVCFAVLRFLGGGSLPWLTRNIQIPIAIIIAAISTLLIPFNILLQVGLDYALLGALVFASPIIGIFIWLTFWYAPQRNMWWLSAICGFILLCIVLMFSKMLTSMESQVLGLKGAVMFSPLMKRLKWR